MICLCFSVLGILMDTAPLLGIMPDRKKTLGIMQDSIFFFRSFAVRKNVRNTAGFLGILPPPPFAPSVGGREGGTREEPFAQYTHLYSPSLSPPPPLPVRSYCGGVSNCEYRSGGSGLDFWLGIGWCRSSRVGRCSVRVVGAGKKLLTEFTS